MLDFKRIGGEIVSSPLNENFRKLRNDISIANTNLVFPESDAIVSNIDEMQAIENPENGQTCYVVSSGELYRFSKHDDQWHKIADFGNTFRQGFLNSGVVILEDDIQFIEDIPDSLKTPQMLVYFKNKKGDGKYLKGMYLIPEHILSLTNTIINSGIYSIFVDGSKLGTSEEIKVIMGTSASASVNLIYLGTFLVDKNKHILSNFIYTMPNMAFTADRGLFLLNGGESKGLALSPGPEGTQVTRTKGLYYYEGINCTKGDTDNYPIDTDNGSNYNIKDFAAESPVQTLYYAAPTEAPLDNDVLVTNGLVINKYWDNQANVLTNVGEGQFTIQQHIVTPNGQNVMFYGTKLYNSLEDAESNINDVYGIPTGFPHVEVTRVIVRNSGENFSTAENKGDCKFYTLGKISQVGTMEPKFADNEFELYSGEKTDTLPSRLQISLKDLQEDQFNDLYILTAAPYNTTRHYFTLDYKYIKGEGNGEGDLEPISKKEENTTRTYKEDKGYVLADSQDLENLRDRVNDIETEIWENKREVPEEYQQSVRYRLYQHYEDIQELQNEVEHCKERITNNENNKVNKATTINGYTLGDNALQNENKVINLKTGDIAEGSGLTDNVNLWYTEGRVSANTDVVNATNHINTSSVEDQASDHTIVNPHNLSTDDLNLLEGTQKIFVTPNEERRIRSDKLPEDTIQELANLDAKNLDSIKIDKLDGGPDTTTGTITDIGNVKGIRFYNNGVNLALSDDEDTLIVECIGQTNPDTVMFRNIYATQSMLYPDTLGDYVDKSILSNSALSIAGMEIAGNNKYYGTNDEGVAGTYDIIKYVSTADAGSFTDIDQITFVPIDGSVQEKHLETSLKNKINNNYHKIYNGGSLSSNEINEFNFGNNLTVSIDGHKATINASGTGGGSGISNFANLDDVNVVYTGNAGKLLTVNEAEDGIELSELPALSAFMLKVAYVDEHDITKVKKAVNADLAVKSTTSDNALKLNNKTVDNTKNDDTSLWTASKIIETIGTKIDNEGVNTYSGTTIPDNSLGKNGDLYILIE